ncbi:hypothetical protein C3432_17680 [Citrobacter amalonaticus]|uniref:Uncharacterized protein n=1 Tax=Citrobacter amalonaticus TaxID=35703 RepID=A0A2S4RTW0_CITAM|nr:hypothetical protein [Citrobacter amalonaticus]POT57186.1 hypothetical protein C3432_17680 [Citrobacter amalonaticus]POT72525.1 hypothetical protein C3436_20205 [Citrobacter amalonaticus]POU63380.1 hypothetical protein C3430_18460 [Citrobacter amalonaticus]POV03144.1 hypothetical protein C3424_21375 [Citrobacter amalonaticus]
MNKINNIQRWLAAILILILTLSLWFYLHARQQQKGMDVNCAASLRYNQRDPDFIATFDMIFRLNKSFYGQVFLFGNIHSERGVEVISRTIQFNYEVYRPGEISVTNMHYAKNISDTANDELFKQRFFYVPENSSRVLRLNPSGNSWLIENLQSPFALCVNKDG